MNIPDNAIGVTFRFEPAKPKTVKYLGTRAYYPISVGSNTLNRKQLMELEKNKAFLNFLDSEDIKDLRWIDPDTEQKTESKSEPKAESKSEPKAEPKIESKKTAKVEPKVEPKKTTKSTTEFEDGYTEEDFEK